MPWAAACTGSVSCCRPTAEGAATPAMGAQGSGRVLAGAGSSDAFFRGGKMLPFMPASLALLACGRERREQLGQGWQELC